MVCSHRPATCVFWLPYEVSHCGPKCPQKKHAGDQRKMVSLPQRPGETPASTHAAAAGASFLRSDATRHIVTGCHLEKPVGTDPLKQLPAMLQGLLGQVPHLHIYHGTGRACGHRKRQGLRAGRVRLLDQGRSTVCSDLAQSGSAAQRGTSFVPIVSTGAPSLPVRGLHPKVLYASTLIRSISYQHPGSLEEKPSSPVLQAVFKL